jgi:YNFM family putative membrane transporter
MPESSLSTIRWVMPGTPAYRHIAIALFLAGSATFSLLYCTQPLLPVFAAFFKVSPTESSLALSLSTGLMALAIPCAAMLSEAVGRRMLICGSALAAAILNIVIAFVPNWPLFLVLRGLEGFLLGGVPAVAMAYLAEEIDPRGLGLAMGLLIGGNAFGGMVGRVLVGILAYHFSWQIAVAVIGLIGLLSAIGVILLLPPSHNFRRRPGFDPAFHFSAWLGHLRDDALLPLFIFGFLSMGAFVALYNYAGFRLTAPPYGLDQSRMGAVFTVYLFGILGSWAAGILAERLGRSLVMSAGIVLTAIGVAVTLLAGLPAMILGVILVTAGFFIAHSVASAWVGRLASGNKGHASSLYLLAYYLGSSIMGSICGWFWSTGGWPAVAGFTATLLTFALAAALRVKQMVRRSVSRQHPL